MADLRNYQTRMSPAGAQAGAVIDEGLRAYMLKVYNLMALGLAITGVAAYGTYALAASNPAFAQLIYASPLKWVVMLAPLALVFFLSFRINSMSVSAAQTTFWVYAALMGLSLSSIFLVFTGQSIVQTFFVTAASFGALSLYGLRRRRTFRASDRPDHGPLRRDHRIRRQHLPCLFGTRLRDLGDRRAHLRRPDAYDTQKLKEMYFEGDDALVAGRKAIMGALTLYLDFINLFMFMLQFLGNKNE